MNNKKYIVIISIMFVVIFALTGYIIYDKVIKKEDNTLTINNENNIQNESANNNENINIENDIYVSINDFKGLDLFLALTIGGDLEYNVFDDANFRQTYINIIAENPRSKTVGQCPEILYYTYYELNSLYIDTFGENFTDKNMLVSKIDNCYFSQDRCTGDIKECYYPINNNFMVPYKAVISEVENINNVIKGEARIDKDIYDFEIEYKIKDNDPYIKRLTILN